jgi:predicted transcriptional regulator
MEHGSLIWTNGGSGFTFLTHHSHVLLLIAQENDVRMRDLAHSIGITERAVQRIVDELGVSGYLDVTREGRRNRYEIHSGMFLRHPVEAQQTIGELLDFGNNRHGHAVPVI